MYEQGRRFGVEVGGVRGLQEQLKSYLTAMNALMLVNDEDAYFTRIKNKEKMQVDGQADEIVYDERGVPVMPENNVIIVTGIDIKKEYEISHARLRLCRVCEEDSYANGPQPTPEEVIFLLTRASQFTWAIRLAKLFEESLEPIFRGLTLKCVVLRSQRHSARVGETGKQGDVEIPSEDEEKLWLLLAHNHDGETVSSDKSPIDLAWDLLKRLLLDEENDSNRWATDLHKTVTKTVMEHGLVVPCWLQMSFQKRDPCQFLRLLIEHGHLLMASTMVVNWFNALMGKGGHQAFGIETTLLTPNLRPMTIYFPHHFMAALVEQLEDAGDVQPEYKKIAQNVTKSRESYLKMLVQVSKKVFEGSA